MPVALNGQGPVTTTSDWPAVEITIPVAAAEELPAGIEPILGDCRTGPPTPHDKRGRIYVLGH